MLKKEIERNTLLLIAKYEYSYASLSNEELKGSRERFDSFVKETFILILCH